MAVRAANGATRATRRLADNPRQLTDNVAGNERWRQRTRIDASAASVIAGGRVDGRKKGAAVVQHDGARRRREHPEDASDGIGTDGPSEGKVGLAPIGRRLHEVRSVAQIKRLQNVVLDAREDGTLDTDVQVLPVRKDGRMAEIAKPQGRLMRRQHVDIARDGINAHAVAAKAEVLHVHVLLQARPDELDKDVPGGLGNVDGNRDGAVRVGVRREVNVGDGHRIRRQVRAQRGLVLLMRASVVHGQRCRRRGRAADKDDGVADADRLALRVGLARTHPRRRADEHILDLKEDRRRRRGVIAGVVGSQAVDIQPQANRHVAPALGNAEKGRVVDQQARVDGCMAAAVGRRTDEIEKNGPARRPGQLDRANGRQPGRGAGIRGKDGHKGAAALVRRAHCVQVPLARRHDAPAHEAARRRLSPRTVDLLLGRKVETRVARQRTRSHSSSA